MKVDQAPEVGRSAVQYICAGKLTPWHNEARVVTCNSDMHADADHGTPLWATMTTKRMMEFSLTVYFMWF
jgi:hypothetical protein